MRRHSIQLLALFSVLAIFACDQVTPVAPVGSTITISVNPSRIDAQGETALVTIIVRKEDGTPVNPGTQVNVSTTLGTLDPEVTFTDETGVAKSELTGDGRIGMATVSATTGAAALVSVEVQIGSVAASITLTATPTNVPKDPRGNEGVIQLLALIRDDTGAPLGGGFVNFRTDIGDLGSQGASVVTNDLGEARDTLTVSRNDISTLSEPFFLVAAQTAIQGGSLTIDEVEIDIRGVPASLTLQVNPSTISEAGGEVALVALVRDSLGDPLEDASVNFLTEVGELASGGSIVRTDAGGRAVDTLRATQRQLEILGRTAFFTVEAETAGLGGSILSDTFQVRIQTEEPIASFDFEVAADGLTVQFTFTGSGIGELLFDWTFTKSGDTTPTATSNDTNPLIPFPTKDLYSARLVVTNDFGTDEVTRSVDLR